jgi:hypothetical protein
VTAPPEPPRPAPPYLAPHLCPATLPRPAPPRHAPPRPAGPARADRGLKVQPAAAGRGQFVAWGRARARCGSPRRGAGRVPACAAGRSGGAHHGPRGPYKQKCNTRSVLHSLWDQLVLPEEAARAAHRPLCGRNTVRVTGDGVQCAGGGAGGLLTG